MLTDKLHLNDIFNLKRKKIELSGLLKPIFREHKGQIFRFKLLTENHEYLLSLSEHLRNIAQNAVWDTVKVRGKLTDDSEVINVDKITLSQIDDLFETDENWDSILEVESYKSIIGKGGKIEPETGPVAS